MRELFVAWRCTMARYLVLLLTCGLGQYCQDLGQSFSLYGPPSRQITYIYPSNQHLLRAYLGNLRIPCTRKGGNSTSYRELSIQQKSPVQIFGISLVELNASDRFQEFEVTCSATQLCNKAVFENGGLFEHSR